ncbi:sulfotransferase family cytosolic 1B member 1 [Ixodes scapularis]
MCTARRVPSTQDIDGQLCCLYYSPTLYRQVPNFEPQDGDIIQVSYPRSGTHWVQQIIQLILSRGESVKTFVEFMERAPFLEVQELKETQSFPRLLRTHFPMNQLRISEKAKYIYVARNPWDTCVSCYHLIRDCPPCKFADGTFDDFLDAFIDAQVGFGDYFDHVISGYDHRRDRNVFFVTYEDLQRNKAEVVLRLAYFLGEDNGKALEENDDVFQRVLDRSTVGFMKDILRTNPKEGLKVLAKNSPHLQPATVIENQKSCGTSDVHIIRKGIVGDWKQHFTPENLEKMRATIIQRTKGSDVMDLWKHD